MGVKDILKASVDHTKFLLTWELKNRLEELEADWHFSSLEKIFFEKRIYRELEKDTETWELVIDAIDKGFAPYKKLFKREITREDLLKLTEKPVRKISRFDIKKADEHIRAVVEEIEEVKNHLNNIVPYTINYYQQIKKKHGKGKERKTELRSFDTIEATKVVVANEKLYVNREEGFFGTGLKKDELVCDCSDIDDIIVFLKTGKYYITKVKDKDFVGKDIIHIAVFKKNDQRTIYNVVYRDGRNGSIMMKRCAITGVTRDKEYDIGKGTEGSQVLYMSANPNGEAEILKVFLKPKPRLRNLIIELDFSQLAIKGRNSMGNIFTRYAIHKIQLKEKGVSTLGGHKIWLDEDVLRLNSDERGKYLGEFVEGDKILVVNGDGTYYLTGFDFSVRFENNPIIIEKYVADKVFSAVYFDGEQDFYYLKRFAFEPTEKPQSFIAEEEGSKFVAISDDDFPCLEITFKGKHAKKDPEQVDVYEFIAVKGYKAKGKRLTTNEVKSITFIEPLQKEIPIPEGEEEDEEDEEVGENDSTNGDDENSATQMELGI